jgi:hypothetical protein
MKMSLWNSHGRFAARATVLAPAVVALFIAQQPAHSQIHPINPVPKIMLRINEVCFDPQGVDGGTEFVELYNYGDVAEQLGGIQLQDHNGTVFFTLPTGTLAVGGYLVVQLGPVVPDQVDSNATDGYAKYFTGQTAADRLANRAGGVILRKNTTTLDAVFWGTVGPPNTAAYSAAVASGNWPANAYVNLAFASGGALKEGDSLGRSTTSADTNTPSDWAPAGGANAIGATPGDRNDVYLFSEEQSIHTAQLVVNKALSYISGADGSSIQVQSGTHDSVVLIDPDDMSGFDMSAHHVFPITISGAPKSLGGTLTSTFERVGTALQTSYTFRVVGTLSAVGGTSLAVDYQFSASGFHGATRTESNVVSVDWTYLGTTYSYDAQIDRSATQTGQNSWTITDTRHSTDWGGPEVKNASTTVTRTRVSDGVYHETASVLRDVMPFPPALGGSNWLFGTQEAQLTLDRILSPDREANITITQFDSQIYNPSHTLLQTSALSESASFVIDRSSGDVFSGLGTWDMTASLKFRVGSPTIDPQSTPFERTLTETLTAEVVSGGEFVEHGLVAFATDGAQDGSFTFYVDGPTAPDGCGCGCGSTSGCNCGSPPQGRTEGEKKTGTVIIGAGCIISAVILSETVAGVPASEFVSLLLVTWLT